MPRITILVWAAWCFDLHTAQQVATLAIANDLRLARKNGNRLAVTLREATAAITAAAARLKFRLTQHADILAHAKAAGAPLEGKLAELQNSGDLKVFNMAYARHRTAACRVGSCGVREAGR
jgi:hypothetical protein